MHFSIAVYPGRTGDISDWSRYMETAKDEGFDEVFVSLHLPEFSLEEQMTLLEEVAHHAKTLGMVLTVDIGGSHFERILNDPEYSGRMRKAQVDFIRLDYGFSMEQVCEISEKWNVTGFMINASIYTEREMRDLKMKFDALNCNIDLRGCHNFYPKPESGLSYEFLLQQNEILRELGIITYSCIPGWEHPRGPLYKGLPTVEVHRNLPLEDVVYQLCAGQTNPGLMMADEYASADTLRYIRYTAEQAVQMGNIWPLRFKWAPGVSEKEKKILKGIHHMRYDSNDLLLRSQSARQMSEYAMDIEPGAGSDLPRVRGAITIDNTLYKRYSGELEIIMRNMEPDPKVNVVGYIDDKEMWKLAHYRYGIDYTFEEM